MSEVKKIIHKVKSLYYMEGGVEREWERDLAALIAHIEKLEADSGGLVAHAEKMEAENARLQATVDKYPKTADGVPAVPGMDLFLPLHSSVGEVNDLTVNDGYTWPFSSGESPQDRIGQCYSTKEAAKENNDE